MQTSLTILTFPGTTPLSSTIFPKSYNLFKNSSGFFISFNDAFHSTDFGFLFLSISIASAQCPAIKYIAAANTSGTPPGGFANDLAVTKSPFLIPYNDLLASSTKGIAAAKSFSVDSFLAKTSVLIFPHFSASILALSFSFSTFSFSTPTIAANFSASFFFFSASTPLTLTIFSISSTYSAVSLNLIRPFSYRSFPSSKFFLFFSSIEVYNLISSKNDFGVVQIYLFS